MSTENLWGSLEGFKKIRTPSSILEEQGEILSQATKGLLRGIVQRYKTEEESELAYYFFIQVPQFNMYKYSLLRISHDVKLYPVHVRYTNKDNWTKCEDEKTFLDVVKYHLSSPETRQIIESLLSQCKAF